MYRAYENPGKLEDQLKELQDERSRAELDGADETVLAGFDESIAELKDRINFAYQDEEYDEREDY